MVRRTQELAQEFGTPVRTLQAAWEQLPAHFDERLVLTSRTWELVRARGSRLDITDRLVRRNGVDAVVIYRWEIAPRWEEEHHLEIAIAQLDGGGVVSVRSELLACWPYRNDELAAELRQVGLRTDMNTFNLEAENYTVVASKV